MEVKAKIYEEEIEEEDVKWLKHYCSMHQILLVGEGDFSFSLSLANAFGSAINIVATSHDAYDILLKKYSKAQSNVEELKKMGASIVHEVDATKMKFHAGLRTRRFDRIVFNFPHAGFKGKEDHPQLIKYVVLHSCLYGSIKLHRQLVRGFFRNAGHMLRPYGEVHVSHKTAAPFSHWNLEELAAENSLVLVESANFCIEDYPGYNNKRGDGSRSDIPFPLGKCSTFKFIIGHIHKTKNPLRKIDLLPSSPSINPIANNHIVCGNIPIDRLHYANVIYPEIHRPVNYERIPRSINGLAHRDTNLWSFSSFNSLGLRMQGTNDFEFRDTAPPPLCRINNFSLGMVELQFSSFPGVSLRSRFPLISSYNTDLLEAPTRLSSGYDYLRHYEELHSRGVSILECSRMFQRQAGWEWDEATRQRERFLCHGI
ncbi:hypothetical protein IEQ34_013000 [Dendrobium chrysotoxum]|uniref:25S rRNA (uridine-N(3))-methyltransferase BMT5-like domain-containing protein n=1 Tax=Dendrobium chrysotoxum TaxID=161865 RepID=A0AAV7GQ84_DENCH|nr:hypothetical protein IEQ34_013000 [Dendrobium chrysotoxum]